MAQVIRITSEALQATIRRLLPSQQGFGEDLQASNVIMPVIYVTPTAEGSQLPQSLAQAITYNDVTNFNATNTSANLATSPGFYRVNATGCIRTNAASVLETVIQITGSLGTRTIWKLATAISSTDLIASETTDFIVFLDTGETLTASSNSANAQFFGFARQIADRYGNIQNPSGFTFE